MPPEFAAHGVIDKVGKEEHLTHPAGGTPPAPFEKKNRCCTCNGHQAGYYGLGSQVRRARTVLRGKHGHGTREKTSRAKQAHRGDPTTARWERQSGAG